MGHCQEGSMTYLSKVMYCLCVLTALMTTSVFAELLFEEKCLENCSGHNAGKTWAENNDIHKITDCFGAKSRSFFEGCLEFVEPLIRAELRLSRPAVVAAVAGDVSNIYREYGVDGLKENSENCWNSDKSIGKLGLTQYCFTFDLMASRVDTQLSRSNNPLFDTNSSVGMLISSLKREGATQAVAKAIGSIWIDEAKRHPPF